MVIPVRNVEPWLPEALDSILAQEGIDLEVIAVDNGSTDRSPAILADYAHRDPRVVVLSHAAGGTGGARNVGVARATGELLTFADPDDIVTPGAYALMASQLRDSGSDFVVGHFVRLHPDGSQSSLPWADRVHGQRQEQIRLDDLPEIVGDVFVWNKVFRTPFWRQHSLKFPENTRYQEQPTITEAFLRAGSFDVISDLVYLWRVREDGSSVTQGRDDLRNLRDRVTTKTDTWALVQELATPATHEVFRNRVMPGDMHHYFAAVPGCTQEYWDELRDMVLALWDGGFAQTSVLPIQRVQGWLVEQNRRDCAAAVASYLRERRMVPVGATTDGTGLALLLDDLGVDEVPEDVRRLTPAEWGWTTSVKRTLTWRGPREQIQVQVQRAGWSGVASTVDATTVTVEVPTPTGTAHLTAPL